MSGQGITYFQIKFPRDNLWYAVHSLKQKFISNENKLLKCKVNFMLYKLTFVLCYTLYK